MADITLVRMRKGSVRRTLQACFGIFARWRTQARGRAELARLSARELRDIGVTPSEALREIEKPFWRA